MKIFISYLQNNSSHQSNSCIPPIATINDTYIYSPEDQSFLFFPQPIKSRILEFHLGIQSCNLLTNHSVKSFKGKIPTQQGLKIHLCEFSLPN